MVRYGAGVVTILRCCWAPTVRIIRIRTGCRYRSAPKTLRGGIFFLMRWASMALYTDGGSTRPIWGSATGGIWGGASSGGAEGPYQGIESTAPGVLRCYQ